MLSNKELWCIITGQSSVLAAAEVRRTLLDNLATITDGLFIHKNQNDESVNRSIADKDVKKREFIAKLSKFLNVDENHTHEIFQKYFRAEFRGCTEQLKNAFEHDAQVERLMGRILDFYFEERKLLLWCIKYILSYWQDQTCLFRAEFTAVVDEFVNQGFIKKILLQYKELTIDGFVHDQLKGNLRTQMKYAIEGLKTQCELLEIILLYYKDFEIPGERFLEFCNIFQACGFGSKQPDKRLLNKSNDFLIERIGCLSNLILLEAIDLETLCNAQLNHCTSKEHLLGSQVGIIQQIDNAFNDWVSDHLRSPVILAWAVFRFHVRDSDGLELCKWFGEKAVSSNVFIYLHSILNWSCPFSKPVGNLTKSLIYSLLDLTCSIFDEESIQLVKIYPVAREVLSMPGLSGEIISRRAASFLELLLSSAKRRFPYDMCPLLDILAVVVNDRDSALYVFEYLKNLNSMTELFSNNSLDEIEATDNPNIWKRSLDRICISSTTGTDSILLPRWAKGMLSKSDGYLNRLIVWQFDYSGWNYLSLELDKYIFNFCHNGSLEKNEEDAESRLISIIRLLKAIIEKDWSFAEYLEPMITCLFAAIQRFSALCSPPMEIIAECLSTLTIVATHAPSEVIDHLDQIGFLPKASDPCSLSSITISSTMSGSYGKLLISKECPSGNFSVTKAYLKLFLAISNMILSNSSDFLSKDALQSLLTNVEFIAMHVFGSHSKWIFVNHLDKEEVAETSLEIFHVMLTTDSAELSSRISEYASLVRQSIYESLLFTEAREPLIQILSTGVDAVNASCCNQQSSEKGIKMILVQVVKLALAVTDRLLRNADPSLVPPFENAILCHFTKQQSDIDFLQPTESYSLPTVIANYIYHRHDAKLPILAVMVLQKLCLASSVSILASFGKNATALRNTFVTRLSSAIEPVRLKIAILDFLTCSIDSQPGIIELFIDQIKSGIDINQHGKYSCVPVILGFLEKPSCNVAIKRASLEFLRGLWLSRSDSALAVIRMRPNSWQDMTSLLLQTDCDSLASDEIRCAAMILEIISTELYYVSNEDFDEGFTDCLKRTSSKLFTNVVKILDNPCHLKSQSKVKRSRKDLLYLLSAWKEYVLIGSSLHAEKCMMNDSSEKGEILLDVVNVMYHWVDEDCPEMTEEIANTVMLFSKKWASSVLQAKQIISMIITVTEKVFQRKNFGSLTDKLFCSLLSLFQSNVESADLNESTLNKLLPLIGCAIADFHAEKVDEISHAERFNGLLVVINLLSVLIKLCVNKSLLCGMLQELLIIPIMLKKLTHCLQRKKCLSFVESALSLFLALSEDYQLTEILVKCGIARVLSTSLVITHDEHSLSYDIWCHSLALVSALLIRSGNQFLDQAIDFVGTNTEQILLATDISLRVHSVSLLKESEQASKLLFALSQHWERGRLNQIDFMNSFQLGTMQMLQAALVFMCRPRLITHVAKCQDKISLETLIERLRTPSPSFSRESNIEALGCKDVCFGLFEEAGDVQEILTSIIVNCTGAMRNLTPNIVEAIQDEGMVLDYFIPLVESTFNSPSLDKSTTLSFGILFSCLNTCLRNSQQHSPCESPRSSPCKGDLMTNADERSKRLRRLLQFIIENTIVIILSQASCYLRSPSVDPRTKQYLKRELSSEMTNFLHSLHRYVSRRNLQNTPKPLESGHSHFSYKRSPSKLGLVFTDDDDSSIFKIADIFAKQLML